jgi:hypothetical protein
MASSLSLVDMPTSNALLATWMVNIPVPRLIALIATSYRPTFSIPIIFLGSVPIATLLIAGNS